MKLHTIALLSATLVLTACGAGGEPSSSGEDSRNTLYWSLRSASPAINRPDNQTASILEIDTTPDAFGIVKTQLTYFAFYDINGDSTPDCAETVSGYLFKRDWPFHNVNWAQDGVVGGELSEVVDRIFIQPNNQRINALTEDTTYKMNYDFLGFDVQEPVTGFEGARDFFEGKPTTECIEGTVDIKQMILGDHTPPNPTVQGGANISEQISVRKFEDDPFQTGGNTLLDGIWWISDPDILEDKVVYDPILMKVADRRNDSKVFLNISHGGRYISVVTVHGGYQGSANQNTGGECQNVVSGVADIIAPDPRPEDVGLTGHALDKITSRKIYGELGNYWDSVAYYSESDGARAFRITRSGETGSINYSAQRMGDNGNWTQFTVIRPGTIYEYYYQFMGTLTTSGLPRADKYIFNNWSSSFPCNYTWVKDLPPVLVSDVVDVK